MPIIKNRTTVCGRTCRAIGANLPPETEKEVSFENKKVKEIDGRSL